MNVKQFYLVVLLTFMELNVHAQNEGVFTNKMVDDLNKKVAPTLQFHIAKDTGTISILNTKQAISLANPAKKIKLVESQSNKPKPGPYIGPIYWIYDIEKTNSTSASFQLDSKGLLQLKISFDSTKTIVIDSKKNAYSCVHRTSDVMPHKVVWEGQKSLLVDLIPKQESQGIHFEVTNLGIQGILRRLDQFEFSKFYTKDLATAFKRELSKVFKNEELKSQFSFVLAAQ